MSVMNFIFPYGKITENQSPGNEYFVLETCVLEEDEFEHFRYVVPLDELNNFIENKDEFVSHEERFVSVSKELKDIELEEAEKIAIKNGEKNKKIENISEKTEEMEIEQNFVIEKEIIPERKEDGDPHEEHPDYKFKSLISADKNIEIDKIANESLSFYLPYKKDDRGYEIGYSVVIPDSLIKYAYKILKDS